MTRRRMFNPVIVESDVFLDMPLTTQALYFHLSMHADDYGFVSPKKIMRMVGAGDDELKILISKRFVLVFESGVLVIKHWHVNNTIRKDRSIETTYDKELKMLTRNEFGGYTEIQRISEIASRLENNTYVEESTTKEDETTEVVVIPPTNGKPNVNPMPAQIRLDKKKSIDTNVSIERVSSKTIDELFDIWENIVGYRLTAQLRANREAASKLLKNYEFDDIRKMIVGVSLSHKDQYAPRISGFKDLYRKWDELKAWGIRKNKTISSSRGIR